MTLSFEKRFPTEEERYEKYIWLLKLSIFGQICAYLATKVSDIAALHLIQPVNMFLWFLINIIILQTAWKSRALHFLFRLWLCASSSVFITVVLMQFFGFLPAVLGSIIAIFANRKHLKVFLRYKSFLKYVAVWAGLSLLVFMVNHLGVMGTDSTLLYILKRVLVFYMFWRLLQHECAQGRPFRETIRILLLMSVIPIFLLIGWFSILPIGPLSGKKIFGEEGHDFLAMQK